MAILFKTLNWCLDLLFPKHCLGCGQEGFYLCADCNASLPTLLSTNCFICGRRSPTGYTCDNCRHQKHSALAGILVAADWNNLLLRQIIYEYKYRLVKELAAPLSQLMINFLQTDKLTDWPTDKLILIPVPLHGRRLAWRGFNQAGILAQKIGDHFKITLVKNILVRSRHTLPQREIKDNAARALNLKNAFALSKRLPSLRVPPKRGEAIPCDTAKNSNPLENKIIVLIDDICTTGATLEDCARALEPLEPKEIWGLVVARG